MKKIASLMVVFLLLVCLVACAQASETSGSTEPQIHASVPKHTSTPVPDPTTAPTESKPNLPVAPDFTVYDIHGNPVQLSDFRGTPVVLNFWASWCPPCKAEMPDFQKEFEAQGQNVQFLIVNITDGERETVDTASAYIAQQGYTFPVFFDTKYAAANAYQVRSIPATYFIDAEGYVVAQASGSIDSKTLQKGISLIWKEN